MFYLEKVESKVRWRDDSDMVISGMKAACPKGWLNLIRDMVSPWYELVWAMMW